MPHQHVAAEAIKTDYLVIGAGAMGMAFVDTMLSDSKASITIVDRLHQPGGHWNMAYPFVTLHQPSTYYGVNSKVLGADKVDQGGWNDGLVELASGSEVCAYFKQVMHQIFVPSGRVTYYSKCDYLGDGKFTSLDTGKTYQAGNKTRIVDATYMKVKVPSMGPPSYRVGDGVQLVTPNQMALLSRPYANYTVVGSGKTGIDSCLWLLGIGVDPSKISWIMPRDQWLHDRKAYQPGDLFAESRLANVPKQIQAIHASTTADDLFHRLADAGQLLRLTDEVWPTMFRCATVSLKELKALRTIKNIIRMGRIEMVDVDKVTLEQGSYQPDPDTLWIDCTADALANLRPKPVFQDDVITLQPVRFCQQNFSAAFIAHVEITYQDQKEQNYICRPIPHPKYGVDWIVIMVLNHRNSLRWNRYPKTAKWLAASRLDWLRHLVPPLPEDPEQRKAADEQMTTILEGICTKLESLIDTLSPEDAKRVRGQIRDSEVAAK
ncbi:hypothetical protein IQ07DRAFT_666128 [Pyrenochaeta sp. DS3sAY3a]|nr:hypothetical protein IQ07DRAFT_666128 [Pyrenochaeta sp. DS3sAY3a]